MTTSKPRPATSISRTAARLSIGAVVAYQSLLIALIFIRPDLDPYWHTISEWAIGRHGWIMQFAFECSALSYGSLFVAIKSEIRGTSGKVGLAILAICTIGTVGVGVFITDPMPMTRETGVSTTGLLHVIFGGSALALLPFAALLINLDIARRNPAWAHARRALLITAGVPLLGIAGFLIHLGVIVAPMGENTFGPGVPLGWPPRFVFMSYMVWLITLATQAIKTANREL